MISELKKTKILNLNLIPLLRSMATEHEKKWKFGMLRSRPKIRFDSVHSGVRRKFEKITVRQR